MSGRLLISKLVGKELWTVVSNPAWSSSSIALDQLLRNFCNDYVEYRNCGVLHRMIRLKDCKDYGIEIDEINYDCILHNENKTTATSKVKL